MGALLDRARDMSVGLGSRPAAPLTSPMRVPGTPEVAGAQGADDGGGSSGNDGGEKQAVPRRPSAPIPRLEEFSM